MHVFIYAFVWKKEKLHKNSFTTFISEVINIDFGIFGILTLRVLGGCVCNLASFWRKLWEDSICEWPLSWEMANFSINSWNHSFVIISNSVFSVLWTFPEKFAPFIVHVIFINKWRSCTLPGQSRVIIQEPLHIKGISKFIKVRNLGSCCVCKNIDHSGSIKMSRCVWRSCFNQWIIENAILIF